MAPKKITEKAPKALRPHPRNSRVHSDEQISMVARSIQEFGFTIPVLVTEGDEIIAGHCRVLAATKLGMAKVPTLTVTGWSEAQIRAYIVADNRLTEQGTWDHAILREELAFLQDAEMDMSAIGGDEEWLASVSKQAEGSGFAPNLTPASQQGAVTGEDMQKAADRMDANRHANAQQALVTVTCPHCGEDFRVSAGQLALSAKEGKE